MSKNDNETIKKDLLLHMESARTNIIKVLREYDSIMLKKKFKLNST